MCGNNMSSVPFIFNSWPSFFRKGRLCNLVLDTEDIYHSSLFGSSAQSYSSGQLLGLKVFPLPSPESQKENICMCVQQPSFTHAVFTHTTHTHCMFWIRAMEHWRFVKLSDLCILKDLEFTVSVSLGKMRPIASTVHTYTLQRKRPLLIWQ